MSVFHNNILTGAAGQSSGGGGAGASSFVIEKSLRWHKADSAFLSKDFGSGGNRRTFTISVWVKRHLLGQNNYFIAARDGTAGENASIRIKSSTDAFYFLDQNQSTNFILLESDAKFRDLSAWYHFVVAVDTTQGTASDRVKAYVNGVELPLTGTYPNQNHNCTISDDIQHTIGRRTKNTGAYEYGDGYLADWYYIDGSALDPTDFGAFDSSGVWQAAAYTGTYPGNSCHLLDFANESTIGHDSSGNNNDFSSSNFSTSAGFNNDVLFDSPTNGSQSDTGAGGEVTGNYAVINPNDQRGTDNGTISDGNLEYAQSSTGGRTLRATIGVSSGKWYWEFKHVGGNATHGIAKNSADLGSYAGTDNDGISWFVGGNIYRNGSTSTYANKTYAVNDIIGVALDMDNGTLTYYKNGSDQGTAATGLTGTWFPAFGTSNVSVVSLEANFGQRPFAYNAPSGFKALCTTNLTPSTVADGRDYFDAKLWTGNSTDQRAITGYQFSPDLVYIKRRNATYGGIMMDTVRGLNSGHAGVLYTNATNAEDTGATSSIRSFNSDGFNLGTDGGINYSGSTYVGWAWDAGSSSPSDNTDGDITSSVKVNASAGFSIGTFTGTSSVSEVGTGLTDTKFVILKNRSSASNWVVYHTLADGSYDYMYLNLTNANASSSLSHTMTNTFKVGTNTDTNASGDDYVFYAFSPVAGYSAFGSYEGLGGTGNPFIYTGFAVKFLMVKRIDTSNNWGINDAVRNTYNPASNALFADNTNSEDATRHVDLLSNGFKLRNSSPIYNSSGGDYIYMAFASNPLQANGGLAR
tara:strand:- start:249 stop:2663 length:2415 start_codon:yes stop_codon:yes gene_type:complete